MTDNWRDFWNLCCGFLLGMIWMAVWFRYGIWMVTIGG